ncbi:MAG: ABC transporter permease [Chloroflexota bacterium]
MRHYLLRRLLLFPPTLLLASLAIFGAIRILPGDIAQALTSGEDAKAVTAESLDAIRERLGLNEPLPVQYGKWIWSMVNGEFGGRSLFDNEPLSQAVARRFPVTTQLALYAIVLAVTVSVPLGVLAAWQRNSPWDYLVRVMTIAGHALPNFWLGIVVILLLLVVFSWTPPLQYRTLLQDPSAHLQKVVWPALILAWGLSANITRVTRSGMLEVLRQDFIRTARSKGLSEGAVLRRHALRNVLVPLVTLTGLQLGALISGAVVLESIFGIPGLGQGMVRAATLRDYPVVQSFALLLVFIMLGLNLVIDLLYGVMDPRISLGRATR